MSSSSFFIYYFYYFAEQIHFFIPLASSSHLFIDCLFSISFARVCQVLGDDFHQYLDMVLPPLLRSAQLPSGIVEVDDDEALEHLPDGVHAWEVLAIEDQVIFEM